MAPTKRPKPHLHLVEHAGQAPPRSAASAAPAAYTNRFGDNYYLHQGTTKTGKARYFVARKVGAGAVATMPEGFEFVESLNGVVSVRCKGGRASLVPAADVETVRRELAGHEHLAGYAVDLRRDEIIVCEPERSLAPSDLAELGRALGLRPREGTHRPNAPTWRTRYAPVMKFAFAFVGASGEYLAYRRHYHGDGGWWMLSHGPLLTLLRKYLPVLGTDEFFELM